MRQVPVWYKIYKVNKNDQCKYLTCRHTKAKLLGKLMDTIYWLAYIHNIQTFLTKGMCRRAARFTNFSSVGYMESWLATADCVCSVLCVYGLLYTVTVCAKQNIFVNYKLLQTLTTNNN